ncbi:MAG: hypothetical protein AB2556_25555, partial [Candidatus Thiodiazotropha sp.]
PVGQDKAPVEARSQVLPLLGGRLGHEQALLFRQVRRKSRAKASATTSWAVTAERLAGKEACSSSIGISDTPTFATKRPDGSVPGYSSRHFAWAFLQGSNLILETVALMALPSASSRVASVWTMLVCMWPRVGPTAVEIRATVFFVEGRGGGAGACSQVARQVVDLGDVRHKDALVRVLQEEVGRYGLFGP